MSEYILCRGNKPSENNEKIQICEIDDLLTDAQSNIKSGQLCYEETDFYKLIFELLDYDISIAMWYDLNCHELKRCVSKEQVLDVCYKGITDEYGFCEIYLIT